MPNELLVNVTSHETRAAFLENGVLSELFIERESEKGSAGNIYKGKVQRVLPGMNAAFVEIGQDKAGFLYASDFSEEMKNLDTEDEDEELLPHPDPLLLQEREVTGEASPQKKQKRSYRWGGREPIQNLLKAGQDILVQITREPISTKGARITSHISLPGRFLVYMPTWGRLGVSKKIASYDERRRLRDILRKNRPAEGGFIVRTAAEGVSEEMIEQDVQFLCKLWQEILGKKEKSKAPCLIQSELDISFRALRDLYAVGVDRICVDNVEEHSKLKQFVERFMPENLSGLQLYQEEKPIFDHFGIEPEINRALGKKVWLKSGGYLIIEQTEALTTIDVNTGKFTGKKNLEETILKINLEAVQEIAYQVKIRNIGGIIILDLIDMEKRGNREKVYADLSEALKKDRAKTSITKISEIGLIEMTRKRSRESLKGVLGSECPYCDGKGYIKSESTVVYDIFRQARRELDHWEAKKMVVKMHPKVLNLMNQLERQGIEEFERKSGKKLEFKACESFHVEQFEFVVAGG
ncbi:MAG: Rne/Rng family ribonuclease [Deltaproteobacteria bacterium]|nr:Rne/Rng family ribonuclease [Deltaproteobacteria bacterium]